MSNRILCALESIPNGGSLGVCVESGVEGHDAMLIRQDESVYAYWNRCPHTGAPLDWIPHNFLDSDAPLIVCAVHGARFTIREGACVAGPCAGESLPPLRVHVQQGDVFLKE